MRRTSLSLIILAATMLALGSASSPGQPLSRPGLRDGSHDMDFNLGTWHTSITRYADPFGSSPEIHLAGTVRVRPVWNGKAELEEIEADGADGHWEGGTLFLYDPQAHQWSQNFVDTSVGRFEVPSTGGYRNGNIEFYSVEDLGGRTVLIRGTWSAIQPDSHRYEEDASNDGGRSWHPAFVADLTRIAH